MKDWRTASQIRPDLVESIRHGEAVPILSDDAVLDLALEGHQPLLGKYADYCGYPPDDWDNLPRLARFYKLQRQTVARKDGSDFTNEGLRADFLDFMKEFLLDYASEHGADAETLAQAEAEKQKMVTDFAEGLGYPRFDGGADDPLLVLAHLPFKTYLTTSPYTFLEKALAKAGKDPCTIAIPWCRTLRQQIKPGSVSGGESATQPLVCHLFGLESCFNSLVLTEDDYLDFVREVNMDRGYNGRDSVPAQVRDALSRQLLVLGFSLNSWSFRALYAGLIKSDDLPQEKRGVCVQLPPSESEQMYLRDYLDREAHFDVIWQDLKQYAKELRKVSKG